MYSQFLLCSTSAHPWFWAGIFDPIMPSIFLGWSILWSSFFTLFAQFRYDFCTIGSIYTAVVADICEPHGLWSHDNSCAPTGIFCASRTSCVFRMNFRRLGCGLLGSGWRSCNGDPEQRCSCSVATGFSFFVLVRVCCCCSLTHTYVFDDLVDSTKFERSTWVWCGKCSMFLFRKEIQESWLRWNVKATTPVTSFCHHFRISSALCFIMASLLV